MFSFSILLKKKIKFHAVGKDWPIETTPNYFFCGHGPSPKRPQIKRASGKTCLPQNIRKTSN
jgi:hypothetical protein